MRRNPDAQARASEQIRAEAEDFRRVKAQDPRATVQELRTKAKAPKPKGQDLTAKAQDPELKPKAAKLK